MRHSTKTKLILAILVIAGLGAAVCFNGVNIVRAQDNSNVNAIVSDSSNQNSAVDQEVNLDENVSASDFGLKEPKLLPDSPFYFLKNWARGIQSFFTFNPIKKLKLKSKFADEKIMEVKKMIEENKNPKIIEKATENYEKEIEEVKKISDKIKEKAEKNPELDKFLDKWTNHQLLHQKLLEKLEKKARPQVLQRIKQARERHLERFKDVMLKLENKDKLPQRLEKVIQNQKGSRFKEIKALEILKRLEDKMPDEAKEAVEKARENILKRIQERLEKMPEKKREMLKNYMEKISGDPTEHMMILRRIAAAPQLKRLREKVMEKMSERIEKIMEEKGCETKWTPPAPDFCPQGRIIIEKDEKGCPLSPKCLPAVLRRILPRRPFSNKVCVSSCLKKYLPGISLKLKTCSENSASSLEAKKCLEPALKSKDIARVRVIKSCLNRCFRVCAAFEDPVCGEDGKTYGNKCKAEIAEVKIIHKGPCGKNKLESGDKENNESENESDKGINESSQTKPTVKSLNPASLANPAAAYCQKMGYKSKIVTKEDGSQSGICVFPDGSKCEEWAFYRAKCGIRYRK
jgi:putative hemolysin